MEPYLLIQTCRSGYKVSEVPVTKALPQRYERKHKDGSIQKLVVYIATTVSFKFKIKKIIEFIKK